MKKIILKEFQPHSSRPDFKSIKCMEDVIEFRWCEWYVAIKTMDSKIAVTVGVVNVEDNVPETTVRTLEYQWPDTAYVNIRQDWPDAFVVEVCWSERKYDLMFQWGEYDELHMLRSDDSDGGFDDETPIFTFD